MSVYINTQRGSNSASHEPLLDKKREMRLPQIIKLASRSPKLSFNTTQAIALPDISRLHSQHPTKVSPILTHTPDKSLEKQLVNLEKLIQREAKLASILETIHTELSISTLCSEYWELSNDEGFWGIEKLFKDSRARKAINDSMIVESLAIALLIFLSSHVHDWSAVLNQIRNMIYFLHQNFLSVIEMVLLRLPLEANISSWIISLKETLKLKKLKAAKRSEHSTYLKQHNEIIANCMKTIIRLVPIKSAPILSMIVHILANRDKFSIAVARSYVVQEPGRVDSEISSPYLPEIQDKDYTLVLDLDETLVHYRMQGAGQLLVRPFCQEFLKEMAKTFEIVIFTAGLQEYADWAIDLIDPTKIIKHRLYRQHTLQIGTVYIKDLSKLGRDLRRILIIDNMPVNFQLQQDNGIFIKSWIGEPNDTALQDMCAIVNGKQYKDIVVKNSNDLRVAVKLLRDLEKKKPEESLLNLST